MNERKTLKFDTQQQIDYPSLSFTHTYSYNQWQNQWANNHKYVCLCKKRESFMYRKHCCRERRKSIANRKSLIWWNGWWLQHSIWKLLVCLSTTLIEFNECAVVVIIFVFFFSFRKFSFSTDLSSLIKMTSCAAYISYVTSTYHSTFTRDIST